MSVVGPSYTKTPNSKMLDGVGGTVKIKYGEKEKTLEHDLAIS